MATQTTQDLFTYYSNLLIQQYRGLPKATAHIQALARVMLMPQTSVQALTFSSIPVGGSIVLTYGLSSTSSIGYAALNTDIQTALRAISGLSSITVSGAWPSFTVTFTGVPPPALILGYSNNTLGVTLAIASVDKILPLAVRDAFNINNTAVGKQLDILGKYAGISRNGYNFAGPVTLSDTDYRTLIQLKVIQNNAGSALSDIQSLLNIFFPGTIYVFDYKNMHMSYFVNTSGVSSTLAEFFVKQNLFPKPMGVTLIPTIFAANINAFFGFRTYYAPASNASPFNDYASYQTDWPWLSYGDILSPNISHGPLLTEDGQDILLEQGGKLLI